MTEDASQKPDQSSSAFGATVIGVMHGIPIIGVLFFGWSPTLILFIYLIENFLTIHFWNKAICRHRLITRKRGHFGIAGADLFSYGRKFYSNALGLTIIHGFVILLLAFASQDAADIVANPLWPLLIISACVVTTCVDLKQRTRNIESRSFEWLDNNIGKAWWDVHSMHFGVFIGGTWLIFGGTEAWLSLPVIGLRALVSYKQHRPFESLETRHPRRWEIGTNNPTEGMIRQWRQSKLEQARHQEEVVP